MKLSLKSNAVREDSFQNDVLRNAFTGVSKGGNLTVLDIDYCDKNFLLKHLWMLLLKHHFLATS